MIRAPGSARQQRLVTTYYDTPDFAVQRAGSVLRVRENDGHFVQTVKATDADAANLLARGEWEDPVPENQPDLQAPESGPHICAQFSDKLRPLFVSDIERVTFAIEPRPGTKIEAAIDRGTLQTADNMRSEAVSEIELELKEGKPAALYDLALELLDVARLRIDLRSKAERGYQLLAKKAEPTSGPAAAPIVLSPTMTVKDALQRVGRACLAHFLRSEPAALAGRIEGIHQMRVAMRRLRSMLSAVKHLLPEQERRWVLGEIGSALGTLGDARNLDVFATELLPRAREESPDQPGWDELGAAAECARDEVHRRVAETIGSPEHTAALLRLLRWFESPGWRQGHNQDAPRGLNIAIGEVAPRVLDRRRRQFRKRSRHFGKLSAHDRHRLRIAVKKLRYATELLGSLYQGDAAKSFVKRLKRVQDDLGHANDVRVAYGIVIELGRNSPRVEPLADAGAQLLAWHERALAENGKKLRRHLRSLDATRPFWPG